jgi:Flp pilus assembly protein TadD
MIDYKEFNRRGSLAARELFQTAQRLFVEGKHQESIAVFTEFMDMRGEKEIALLSRGVAYLKTEKIDNSIEDFGKVITLNSQNVRAYFYRGTALMAKEDFENAVKDFDKTIELKPDQGAAFFARGSAYAQIGNEYEAVRNIRKALTFSEMNVQGGTEDVGLFRTQIDKAMAVMTDSEKILSVMLTENEIVMVKKWLDQMDQ